MSKQSIRDLLKKKTIKVPQDRLLKPAANKHKNGRASEVALGVAAVEKRVSKRLEYQSVKAGLHERLIDDLNKAGMLNRPDDELKQYVEEFVSGVLETEDVPLNQTERTRLADELQEEALGSGPLSPLMGDPAITDILVNRFDAVYVERFGVLEPTNVRFRDEDHLIRIITRIAARVGRRIDTSSPMVDARLPDGSRVNATLPPVSLDGPTLSIRRFGQRRLTSENLVRLGMLSGPMLTFLDLCVVNRKNILISGGTGSGKSTLLGAVSESIPAQERIITIEDAAELMLEQDNVIRMETRAANVEGQGEITQRDLVVNALRMRPDRIVMGEVRAGEALDMLQAMNTGHDGSLTTIHANSPRDAFARLETMVMMAGMDLPSRAIREQPVSAISIVVHVRRFEDGTRRIERIAEVVGIEGQTPQLQDIYVFKQTGKLENRITGRFVTTGIVPRIYNELAARGIEISKKLSFEREIQ